MKKFLVLIVAVSLVGIFSLPALGNSDLPLTKIIKNCSPNEYVAAFVIDKNLTLAVQFDWDGQRICVIRSLMTKEDVVEKIYDNLLEKTGEGLEVIYETISLTLYGVWSWPTARNR